MSGPTVHTPEETSDQSSASEDAAVEATLRCESVEMGKRLYSLADLLSRITEDNLHSEQDTGAPQGNEQW